ncbi:MAG: Ribosomal protein S6--L-glutamate ligase [Candidatus Anoxychlamydiales bacterium]|nr:Ribosomal protein S6--L-glutamate ligase [Candidatus Anoxychlamydiales bacterium]
MKHKTIALWMYRNDGGDIIQEKLKTLLENENIKVINNFDMRECYSLNGRVYTQDGFDLSSVDAFYHMNMDEFSEYQNEILQALELSGVKTINTSRAFNTAKDKFITNLLLTKNGINVPPAMLVNPKNAPILAKDIFDKWKIIIIKPTGNHGGKGIIKFDDLEQFKDFVEATKDSYKSYYIEKFIDFDEHDYRVEIFKNKVIWCYCRGKNIHSFKTNISSGGHLISDIPSKEFEEIALKATKIIDIDTTIVDMIRSKEDGKIYILEVNPIMGIFLESFLKYSNKVKERTSYGSLLQDEKKLALLTKHLISLVK